MRISPTPAVGLLASHTALVTGVHGVTGDVVGTTDTQILTNKEITSLEITNVGAGANPVFSVSSTAQLLELAGGLIVSENFTTLKNLAFKSATAFYVSLVHAVTANRTATWPDKDITVAGIVDLEEYLMIGAGNSKWIPLVWAGGDNSVNPTNLLFSTTGAGWYNLSGDDGYVSFMLGLPIILGSKTLHIKAVRFGLRTADATNYVTALNVWKSNETADTSVDNDTTDRTAQGEYTLTFSAAESLTGFNTLIVLLNCVLADVGALTISHVEADVYYA